jgi:hypothetical protein
VYPMRDSRESQKRERVGVQNTICVSFLAR